MNAIHPIAQTDDTVTLSRADYERLLALLEDAEDIAALDSAAARKHAHGEAAAHADYLPAKLVSRLLAGEHPVRIWREHRGLSQEQLAGEAGVARSYLAEIEGGKKPGSASAYRKLANALGLAVDDLMPADETRSPGLHEPGQAPLR
jgi:ribosome-binding protein aMBF1 (putative translation factor)